MSSSSSNIGSHLHPPRGPIQVSATPRQPADTQNTGADGQPHAPTAFPAQLGHSYKVLLKSRNAANANANQWANWIECTVVLAEDLGLAPRSTPGPGPGIVHGLKYPSSSFRGQPPRIGMEPRGTSFTYDGHDLESPHVQGILAGKSGGLSAMMAWGVFSGVMVGYHFTPEHRDMAYFAGAVADTVGPLVNKSFPLASADVFWALRYIAEGWPDHFGNALLYGREDLLARIKKEVVVNHPFLQEMHVIAGLRLIADHVAFEPAEDWVNDASLLARGGELFALYLAQQKHKSPEEFMNSLKLLQADLLATKPVPGGMEASYLGRRQGIMIGLMIGGALRCSALYTASDKKHNERLSAFVDTTVDTLAALAGPGAAAAAALGGLIKLGCKELQKERDFVSEIQTLRGKFRMELARTQSRIRDANLPVQLDLAEAVNWLDIAVEACGKT